MRQTALLFSFLVTLLSGVSCEDQQARAGKTLSVFNVVKFLNDACGASNGLNGTCYTSSECSSLGGTASGTCASSFGVCCVFSIASGLWRQQQRPLHLHLLPQQTVYFPLIGAEPQATFSSMINEKSNYHHQHQYAGKTTTIMR